MAEKLLKLGREGKVRNSLSFPFPFVAVPFLGAE